MIAAYVLNGRMCKIPIMTNPRSQTVDDWFTHLDYSQFIHAWVPTKRACWVICDVMAVPSPSNQTTASMALNLFSGVL